MYGRRAVKVFWNIDQVRGDLPSTKNFLEHFELGFSKKLQLTALDVLRIELFATSSTFQVTEQHMEYASQVGASINVNYDGTNVKRINQEMTDVLNDCDPKKVSIVIVSIDRRHVPFMKQLSHAGFNVYTVCIFDKDIDLTFYKQIEWLPIYNFFVISHGDVDKILGKKDIKRGRHPRTKKVVGSANIITKKAWTSPPHSPKGYKTNSPEQSPKMLMRRKNVSRKINIETKKWPVETAANPTEEYSFIPFSTYAHVFGLTPTSFCQYASKV